MNNNNNNNNKVVTRLMTEINNSRKTSLVGSRCMTPEQEYAAWQAYSKDLTRQKGIILHDKDKDRSSA